MCFIPNPSNTCFARCDRISSDRRAQAKSQSGSHTIWASDICDSELLTPLRVRRPAFPLFDCEVGGCSRPLPRPVGGIGFSVKGEVLPVDEECGNEGGALVQVLLVRKQTDLGTGPDRVVYSNIHFCRLDMYIIVYRDIQTRLVYMQVATVNFVI